MGHGNEAYTIPRCWIVLTHYFPIPSGSVAEVERKVLDTARKNDPVGD